MSYRIETGIESHNDRHQDQDEDTFTGLNVLGCLLFFVELALFWVVIGT